MTRHVNTEHHSSTFSQHTAHQAHKNTAMHCVAKVPTHTHTHTLTHTLSHPHSSRHNDTYPHPNAHTHTRTHAHSRTHTLSLSHTHAHILLLDPVIWLFCRPPPVSPSVSPQQHAKQLRRNAALSSQRVLGICGKGSTTWGSFSGKLCMTGIFYVRRGSWVR